MSGFVGIINLKSDQIDPALLTAMSKLIQHRDWYKCDHFINARGTIGISRVHLGIIDNGEQPYWTRQGQLQIMLHGHLYNDEIRYMSPLAFVEQLYEKHGAHFARYLDGSFLCIVIDEARNTVLLATDRLTSQPLFYFRDQQTFYFSPEIKSLLLVPALARRFNWGAIQDFLTAGHFTANHTWLEGVQKLNNATVLKLTPQGSTEWKYWEYEIAETEKDLGFPIYQEQLADLLQEAVRKRIQTQSKYGILLSGGYDSRGILGCYLENQDERALNTISWGDKEELPNSDGMIARHLAQQVGANHQFYERSAEDVIENYRNSFWVSEGLTATVSDLSVFDRIKERQGIELLFRGDTCLGRYPEGGHKVFNEHTLFRRLDLAALESVHHYKKILKPEIYQIFCELNRAMRNQLSARCSAKNFHNRHTFFYVDVRVKYLYNSLNYTKSMVNEVLVPWLDNDILDFVRNLPVRYRLGKSLYVATVVKLFPQLFTEVAKARNDISWYVKFKSSPHIQAWVYHELVESQSMLAEFVDPKKLKQLLDATFATSARARALAPPIHWKEQGRELLATSPDAYDFVYKSMYYYQKWKREVEDVIVPEQLIWRLMALKTWGDMFLPLQPFRTSDTH